MVDPSMVSMSSMSLSMEMSMSPGLAVTVAPRALHGSHESEASHDSEGPQQAGHAVLGQLVPGQHLEEGDVEEGPSRQALQDPDD